MVAVDLSRLESTDNGEERAASRSDARPSPDRPVGFNRAQAHGYHHAVAPRLLKQ